MYTEEQLQAIIAFLKEIVVNLDSWHLDSVLMNIKSPQVMQAIIDHDIFADKAVLCPLARNPNINAELLAKLYQKVKTISESKQTEVLCDIFANPNVAPDFVLQLLRSGELDKPLQSPYNIIASRIASNSKLPLEVIEELVMHLTSSSDMATVLKERSQTISSKLVEYIYNKMKHNGPSPFGYVSGFVGVKNIPGYILGALYKKHYNYEVRTLFAKNPNTPSHILAELAFDKHKNVRAAALANPHTPPETLSKAAHITASRNITNANMFLEAIIWNPACPQEVLLDLIMYHNKNIATAARQALAERQGTQLTTQYKTIK